jgi:hypothetical protein
MNFPLKRALNERLVSNRPVPAYVSAKEAGIKNPNKIYKIVSGLVKPSDEDKENLARILDCPVDELFPEKDTIHV